MENAVQALKTAAAVLIFIIAITTSFTMFSKAKITADAVITAQDKQKYLDSPTVNGGILYTSSEDISSGQTLKETMTKEGYRIVTVDDVISTLYRYSIEKYGVTIIDLSGNVIARFDSNTESIVIPNWNNKTDEDKDKIIKELIKNTTVNLNNKEIKTKFSIDVINNLYKFKDANNKENIDTMWYTEEKDEKTKEIKTSGIIKHINALINGSILQYERTYI